MEEAIEFLRRYVALECRAQRAKLTEPDHRAFIELVWELDKLYGGPLRSGVSRPNQPAAVYASPDYVAAAMRERPRSIFAVARYRPDGDDVYRAWLGDTELGRRGESMPENVYVAREGGDLKVLAVHRVCSGCRGTGVDAGEPCSICGTTGWLHLRGIEWPELGPPLEVRRLAVPSDPLSKPAYDAIPSA